MRELGAAVRANTIPPRSSSGARSSHPAPTPFPSTNTSSCSWTTSPGWPSPIFSRHDNTSNKGLTTFCYIGGSPQTFELQVGQLISEGSAVFELGLKNEERSRLGFWALHLGQFNLEPSSPID